ncbi:hypothetical protein N7497_003914 [Penicillium chrysogenum]|nr:hypothetical protein N7497_003914 [Penicillium chrysogenum]
MTTAQNTSRCYNKPSEMEVTGFVVFSASSDGADINAEVKRSLTLWPKIESKRGPFVYGRGDAAVCERFLRCGAEDGFTGKIKEAIGEVGFIYRQGPVIVVSSEDHSTWGTALAHPSHDAVSIFRDLSDTDEIRLTFKLYPQGAIQPFVRKLRRNEILFVKGSVRMEIEVPSGGSFVWQGNSGEPMGRDIHRLEVFEFMAL